MAKTRVKIYWEARWEDRRGVDEAGGETKDRTQRFDDKDGSVNEAACRLFAQQKAFDLRLSNTQDSYTVVSVHECELHEERVGAYTAKGVIRDLNPPRAGEPDTDCGALPWLER